LAVIDPERITQVLTNFIGNAVKYSPDGKPIIVRLTQQGQTALIEFQDQGPGISPEDQEHLWERSYRVEGIKSYHKAGANLGMGLYICRLIIQQHHGDYGIRSAPGQGSTFWFTLPLEIQCSDTPAQSKQS
jgi:signal transduction histidine kinase